MIEEICGEPLKVRDGKCQNSATYDDEKCGLHSEYSNVTHAPDPSLEIFLEYLSYSKRMTKPETWNTYRSAILAFDKFLQEEGVDDPIHVNPLTFENWFAWLSDSVNGRGLAESSASEYMNSLSPFYKWLIRRGDIEENPIYDSEWRKQLTTGGMPEKKKALKQREDYYAPSTEEVKLLLEHAQTPKFRSQLIIKLFAQTGIRPHELRNIRVQDVRDESNQSLWDNNRILIHSEKTERYTGSISGTRTVRYQDSLSFYLRKWLNDYRGSHRYAEESDYLFPSNHSERIALSTISGTVTKAAEAAGIQETIWEDAQGGKRKKITAYSLRHYFASQMADEVTPSTLAELMGSDVSTIEKYYVEHREEKLDEAADLVPDV